MVKLGLTANVSHSCTKVVKVDAEPHFQGRSASGGMLPLRSMLLIPRKKTGQAVISLSRKRPYLHNTISPLQRGVAIALGITVEDLFGGLVHFNLLLLIFESNSVTF